MNSTRNFLPARANYDPNSYEPEYSQVASQQSDGEDICTICKDQVQCLVILQCSHSICSDCFQKVRKKECPFCRAPLVEQARRVPRPPQQAHHHQRHSLLEENKENIHPNRMEAPGVVSKQVRKQPQMQEQTFQGPIRPAKQVQKKRRNVQNVLQAPTPVF